MSAAVEQNCGDISISVSKYDSRNELNSRLGSFEKSMLLSDEEVSASDFILLVTRSPDEKWSVGCGLCCASPISPQIVWHPKRFIRWVLFDHMVYLVNFHDAKVIFNRRLPGTFYDVFLINNTIMVVHELGVETFDQDGKCIWQIVGHDILVEHHKEGKKLVCRFENGETISHEL